MVKGREEEDSEGEAVKKRRVIIEEEDTEEDDEAIYEVEKLIDVRKNNKGVFSKNIWEPESFIHTKSLLGSWRMN